MKMKKIWEDFLLKTENDVHPIESFKPICGNTMSFMGIRAKIIVPMKTIEPCLNQWHTADRKVKRKRCHSLTYCKSIS